MPADVGFVCSDAAHRTDVEGEGAGDAAEAAANR